MLRPACVGDFTDCYLPVRNPRRHFETAPFHVLKQFRASDSGVSEILCAALCANSRQFNRSVNLQIVSN